MAEQRTKGLFSALRHKFAEPCARLCPCTGYALVMRGPSYGESQANSKTRQPAWLRARYARAGITSVAAIILPL
jgi:hypothetical protein